MPSLVAGKSKDPWVELLHGFVRDQPLGMTGRIVQVVVHPPGTIVRRSEALDLGIAEDDFRPVAHGPQVRNLPEGFAVVLEPRSVGGAPMGRGPVVSGPGW